MHRALNASKNELLRYLSKLIGRTEIYPVLRFEQNPRSKLRTIWLADPVFGLKCLACIFGVTIPITRYFRPSIGSGVFVCCVASSTGYFTLAAHQSISWVFMFLGIQFEYRVKLGSLGQPACFQIDSGDLSSARERLPQSVASPITLRPSDTPTTIAEKKIHWKKKSRPDQTQFHNVQINITFTSRSTRSTSIVRPELATSILLANRPQFMSVS